MKTSKLASTQKIPSRFAMVFLFGNLVTSSWAAEQTSAEQINKDSKLVFTEVTKSVGLSSSASWKYGGPAIADLNGDGRYELLLSNHHEVPAQLFWGGKDARFTESAEPLLQQDVHGIAPGDYDADGDVDFIVSVGGGNGTTPQPPRLFRNDNNRFIDVTEQSGLAERGARGRSVRWIDLDLDGDLDLIQINAAVMLNEEIPRNLIYENLGNGKFRYVENKLFENIDAERVLVTDFNGDHVADIVCFSPLSLWQGTGDMSFTDVTIKRLPQELQQVPHVLAAADFDFDNDGDLDLYLSRGKTYYELANNSVELNSVTKRLDIRDEGNQSRDGMEFKASGPIELADFFRWYRGIEFDPQVFLGAQKDPIPAPVSPRTILSEQALGFPESRDESGWYLGYLGDNRWRLEWYLAENLAWDIRASIIGVESISIPWVPQDPSLPDLLLVNEQGSFKQMNELLPSESAENNWGVTPGDFNNDGWTDLFVYRFGFLNQRVADAMLLNQSGKGFLTVLDHGAFSDADPKSHGDMGAAFDYNLDGRVDILSGDDDQGRWHLYQNDSTAQRNYLLVEVGYAASGVDAIGAEVWLEAGPLQNYRKVGSAGATHSQSILNTLHFGLADKSMVSSLKIRWRDGSTEELKDIKARQTVHMGINRQTLEKRKPFLER